MRLLPAILVLAAMGGTAIAQQVDAPVLAIDWAKTVAVTRTTITLQVVENPPLRRGSPIHDSAWRNLAALHTDMTRLALWYPYPRLAVAELAGPEQGKTSWDFAGIDPIVEDFFRATDGRSRVFTMSTIPTWMFRQADPGAVPADADEAMWGYEAGEELRDPSGQEVADYFGRVAGWYVAGGFTDELGRRHVSGHREQIAWWEVLNEPEYEHALDIRTYTKIYDRTVAAVHAVTPATHFVGMSLAEPMRSPEAFEYFLNPANHARGTPLDAVSFHFYADAEPGETDETEPYSFFARADAFLDSARFIDGIRKRLSPKTELHVNEAGCIAADDLAQGAERTGEMPSAQYWNLCGAVFAYLYTGLAAEGVEVLGASQLVGYPTQFPSVTLLDWNTGAPNARYRVLQLMHDAFGPGDRLVKTSLRSHEIVAAAYVGSKGEKKLLLVNKSNRAVALRLEKAGELGEEHVDAASGAEISRGKISGDTIHLGGLAVMVVRFAK